MFNEQNITKRSNLESHDSISCYLNHGAQQNPYTYESFYNLIKAIKPSRILEIGTSMGGFTLFLKIICEELNLITTILTNDIHYQPGYKVLETNGIHVKIENLFNGDYSQVKAETIEYIQQDGTTLVLCDGGWKIGEFNLLSRYIKQGDIIMAHDYASTPEYFKKTVYMKFWNWHEIQDSDIQESVANYCLDSFMQEQFTPAAWVCKIKK